MFDRHTSLVTLLAVVAAGCSGKRAEVDEPTARGEAAWVATGQGSYSPAGVTWLDGTTERRETYVPDSLGRLVVRSEGANGTWTSSTHCSSNAVFSTFGLSAVVHRSGGVLRKNLFGRAQDGSLAEAWFDGTQWRCNTARPTPGTYIEGRPSAMTWVDSAGATHIHVFMKTWVPSTASHGVAEYHWNGAGWYWNTTHANGVAVPSTLSEPVALSWRDGTTPQLRVFFVRERLTTFSDSGPPQPPAIMERRFDTVLGDWVWINRSWPAFSSAPKTGIRPAAVAWMEAGEMRNAIFVAGLGNALMRLEGSAAATSGWGWSLDGTGDIDGDPVAAVWQPPTGPKRFNVFYQQRASNALVELYKDAAGWHQSTAVPPQSLGPAPAVGALIAPYDVSTLTTQLYLLGRSSWTDPVYYWQMRWNGTSWAWSFGI